MKNLVEVIRVEQGEEGTFGVLKLNGQAYCVTLEPPQRGNVQNISCIPAGEYHCKRVSSPRFGETYEITDVPGRSHILFHAGNVVGDTSGCVLLGRHFGRLGTSRAVLDSGRTFSDFITQCEGNNEFPLVIREGGAVSWTTTSA
ncbi:MAG: hypothetical protein CL942_11475 [Desulfovibrio sp.]|nr:hypothetical protein [Desulfovibrio sp.]